MKPRSPSISQVGLIKPMIFGSDPSVLSDRAHQEVLEVCVAEDDPEYHSRSSINVTENLHNKVNNSKRFLARFVCTSNLDIAGGLFSLPPRLRH